MGRLKLSKKISLIVAATLVASNFVLANGAKNCITDLKLNSDGKNVKVDIYTDKPYSEPVVVNKKEGNRYVILIPEIPYDFNSIVAKIKQRKEKGKNYSIIVVAEGAKPIGGDIAVKSIVADSPDAIRLGGAGEFVAREIEKFP